MADWNDPRATRQGFGAAPSQTGDLAGRTTFDAGLRRHMLSIYNYMTSAVLLTGIVALLFSRGGAESPAAQVFVTTARDDEVPVKGRRWDVAPGRVS